MIIWSWTIEAGKVGGLGVSGAVSGALTGAVKGFTNGLVLGYRYPFSAQVLAW